LKSFLVRLFVVSVFVASIIGAHLWFFEEKITSYSGVSTNVQQAIKIAKLLQQVPNPQVVFAGDSRAGTSLNPNLFVVHGVSAINIAMAGSDPWSLVKSMELTGLSRSKATFLISTSIFTANDGTIEEGQLSPEQFFEMTFPERIKMCDMSYFFIAQRMLKKAENAREIKEFLQYRSLQNFQIPNTGFVIDTADKDTPSCEPVRFGSKLAKNHFYSNMNLDGAKWRLFKSALHKFAEWQGTYIIYNPAMSPAYKECAAGTYVEEAERRFSEKIHAVVASINKPNKIIFVNFYDNPNLQLENKYFFDTHHLNSSGAEIFSNYWLKYLTDSHLIR
jgi:hypothetical protein